MLLKRSLVGDFSTGVSMEALSWKSGKDYWGFLKEEGGGGGNGSDGGFGLSYLHELNRAVGDGVSR